MLEKAPVDVVDRYVAVVEVEADFCDTCLGSGAYVKSYVFVKMPSGKCISYCAHHGTKYWDALSAQSTILIDMRDTVLAVTI